MSKPKITTETIREIRNNQREARRAGAAAAMARVAGFAAADKAPTALLEAPTKKALLPAASAKPRVAYTSESTGSGTKLGQLPKKSERTQELTDANRILEIEKLSRQ